MPLKIYHNEFDLDHLFGLGAIANVTELDESCCQDYHKKVGSNGPDELKCSETNQLLLEFDFPNLIILGAFKLFAQWLDNWSFLPNKIQIIIFCLVS